MVIASRCYHQAQRSSPLFELPASVLCVVQYITEPCATVLLLLDQEMSRVQAPNSKLHANLRVDTIYDSNAFRVVTTGPSMSQIDRRSPWQPVGMPYQRTRVGGPWSRLG